VNAFLRIQTRVAVTKQSSLYKIKQE
jgi:hypothetical protein